MQEAAIDIRATLVRALELRDAGRLTDASALCGRVVAAAPRHEGARRLLGVLALEDGRLDEAETALRAAIALAPGLTAAHLSLGLALRRLGRAQEAIGSYDQALALGANPAKTHNARGVALLDLGRSTEALASFDAALAAQPRMVTALSNRGLALLDLGRPAEALASVDAALALAPSHATALHGRGNALMALGQPAAAVTSYDSALAATPDHVEALANRGTALLALRRTAEAVTSFAAATALQPDNPLILLGQGNAMTGIGEIEAAEAAFDKAVALKPDFAEAVHNRGVARLTLGQYAAGWTDYGARWKMPAFLLNSSHAMAAALQTRFDPELSLTDLAGRRVLVAPEQGVGDIIMFASMLPNLLRVAAKVTLICEPRFARLFRHSFPQIEVRGARAEDARPDVHDHVLPIGDLGRLFRTRAQDFPGTPYLSASAEVRRLWDRRLRPRDGRLRMGVSWRGGLARTRGDERSLPLSGLRPLLDLPRCDVVSLQYGDVAAEVDAENAGRARPMRQFPADEITDFEDLAGLIQSLDLVVSVQTAVVHLASAVGTPCLVMTPQQPEWRYASPAGTLPWYRSVRVFRLGADGDWARLLDLVASDVTARLA